MTGLEDPDTNFEAVRATHRHTYKFCWLLLACAYEDRERRYGADDSIRGENGKDHGTPRIQSPDGLIMQANLRLQDRNGGI